jgi:hypothetical protein
MSVSSIVCHFYGRSLGLPESCRSWRAAPGRDESDDVFGKFKRELALSASTGHWTARNRRREAAAGDER